jgi:hypothetical protein
LTRLKPRRFDKLREAFGAVDKAFVDSAVDKAFVDRGDPHDSTKIKKLEDQMDCDSFVANLNLGTNNQKNYIKKMKKSHNGLR